MFERWKITTFEWLTRAIHTADQEEGTSGWNNRHGHTREHRVVEDGDHKLGFGNIWKYGGWFGEYMKKK